VFNCITGWDGCVELGEQFHQHWFAQEGNVSRGHITLQNSAPRKVHFQFSEASAVAIQKQSDRGICSFNWREKGKIIV